MKKLVSVLFALILFFSAASCDSVPFEEYCYYEGYGHIEVLKSGAPYMAILYLAEDHTCYYLTQMFNTDEPRLGRAYVGTWETLDDGKIFAKIGENSSRTLKPSAMDCLVDVETLEVFSPFSVLFR